jgi:heterodisulfide reductase subunit A-like polyferredoxin
MSAAPKWYYARGNQRVGPLTSAELRALAAKGTLSPTDMVLKEGTPKWAPAASVKGLFTAAAPAGAAPPPEPTAVPLSGAASRSLLLGALVSRRQALAEAQVVPDAGRCVQCGCCSYNCPMGIDVRDHARQGKPIHDSHCLTCGECVKRCPRGVLSFSRLALFCGG